MEVLVTGNIKWLENDFFEELAERNKVVVCGPGADRIDVDKVTPYKFDIDSDEFEQLFFTFNFDRIIYMSWALDREAYNEMRCLDRIFAMCRKREKTKMVYVKHTVSVSAAYGKTHAVIENACDEMCREFCEEGRSLLKLSVPYLVSGVKNTGVFDACYQSMEQERKLELAFCEEHVVDFLFGRDLAAFLSTFFEEDEGGYLEYDLYGGNDMTARDMAEVIIRSAGFREYDIDTAYGHLMSEEMPGGTDWSELRRKYGWFPKEKLENCAADWHQEYVRDRQPAKKRFRDRLASKAASSFRERLINAAELALLFAVCELLTYSTRNMQLVDFADFRLFFVVMAGMMYGLRYGMIAAAASCAAYLVSLGGGTNWQIQFYNIINWLPFATYLLTGAIAGYTKDRHEDTVKNLQKSQDVMEDKYIYLNELYTKVLENKESYSSQIVNYRNSYGRIYAATKQLNYVRPGEIFYHAIAVLEDMLDTQSVAIYSLDGGNFARLNACSRDLMDKLTKSLRLSSIPECRKVLEASETWVNRERLEGEPDYAYGIYRDSALTGIIAIHHAQYEQMSMEYMNRFNIVSGLISDALVRAAGYHEISENEVMIEGTKIMKYEPFAKELEAQQMLKENNRANFILMKVLSDEQDFAAVSAKLLQVTRKNDILGVDRDGRVYILMAQADMGSLDIINRRLEGGGIKAKVVRNMES